MRSHFPRWFAAAVLVAGVVYVHDVRTSRDASAQEKPKFTPEQVAFFEKDVLPVLKQHCFKCHGDEPKLKGGLNLTNRQAILDGGDYAHMRKVVGFVRRHRAQGPHEEYRIPTSRWRYSLMNWGHDPLKD